MSLPAHSPRTVPLKLNPDRTALPNPAPRPAPSTGPSRLRLLSARFVPPCGGASVVDGDRRRPWGLPDAGSATAAPSTVPPGGERRARQKRDALRRFGRRSEHHSLQLRHRHTHGLPPHAYFTLCPDRIRPMVLEYVGRPRPVRAWRGVFGLWLLSTAAFAQAPQTHPPDHPDVVIMGTPLRRAITGGTAAADSSGRVSTTPDNQILVELTPGDLGPAHRFDLNGRTVIFTPDGHGGYSRSVRSVVWEENIGSAVTDGTEILFRSFMFDFAGHRWGSFFVSQLGLITFGEPLTYSYENDRFSTLPETARKFVTTPTISPLFKPTLGRHAWSDKYSIGQHVAASSDRVVVTWVTTEAFDFYVHGVPPDEPSRFQVVLAADGSIRFNYADVDIGDGIVGLFDASGIERGALLAHLADLTDSELPGHLDVLDAALFATNADPAVILEFTLRAPIPDPSAGEYYSYSLHFDTDEPYWNHPLDWSDEDAFWGIHVGAGGEYTVRGEGVRQFLAGRGQPRISLLADASVLDGGRRRVTAMAVAGAAHFRNDQWLQGEDDFRGLLEFRVGGGEEGVDLSVSDNRSSPEQFEVFHYRSAPDLDRVACSVIDVLGDEFDLLVFHSEFRVDSQEGGAGFLQYWTNINVKGIGDLWDSVAPCGSAQLKGRWSAPVWMKSINVLDATSPEDHRFDFGSMFFAHEFTHTWTAYASRAKAGRQREPLHGNYCRCHWRFDLHAPAAFPWSADEARSVMGGRFWREKGDGTFTPLNNYYDGGHSWLDLYMMGLASANEVPDMFILRNARPVNAADPDGPHTGEKEVVSIEQIVAAEGRRIPPAEGAQRDFNAGFVYLLAPGRTPNARLLQVHAEYRDKVTEHWSHITGGRSRMTTRAPGVAQRSLSGDGSASWRSR